MVLTKRFSLLERTRRNRLDWSRPLLSPGAGAPTFVASPNPTAQWDDPGYGNPEEHQLGVMTQPEINNRRGFVVHDACWSLLTHVYAPREVPHARLFDILSSFPITRAANCIDWAHDYGGLYRFETSL